MNHGQTPQTTGRLHVFVVLRCWYKVQSDDVVNILDGWLSQSSRVIRATVTIQSADKVHVVLSVARFVDQVGGVGCLGGHGWRLERSRLKTVEGEKKTREMLRKAVL